MNEAQNANRLEGRSASATVVVHYAELGLKGKNRPFFEKKLAENIQRACERDALKLAPLKRQRGRIRCAFAEADREKIERALRDVFGIQYFAFAEETPSELEAVLAKAGELLAAVQGRGARSVGLETRRADKSFPLSSLELNKRIGAEANRLGLRINFSSPDETLHIEIAPEKTYFYVRKIPGPGGFPVGASGRVLCLLSGGIDSAVAAWLLMKRGCRVDFLHFHSFRENREVLESKVRGMVEVLNRFQFSARLFLVPYHRYQIFAAARVPEPLDLVAFRNFMFRFAQQVARRKRCRALVTGDSLGQVASQTLANLAASDSGLSMPVLRPLVGFDKQEIVALARRIGTYEESIKEYKDCCSIIARKPAIAVKPGELRAALGEGELEALIQECLGEMEIFKLSHAPDEGSPEPLPTGGWSAT